jgi:rod shape-determining protein MreC
MPQFFSNKKLIVFLVSIILLVALIGISMRDREKLTLPEQFIMDSVGWIQSMFYQPAQYVAGFFENIEEIKNTYNENKILKSKLEDFVKISVEANQLRTENKKLLQLLNKKDSLRDYVIRHGTVIARTPEGWHNFFSINIGQQDGVKRDMAVITANGLIGKVKDVSQFSATVQLLTDVDRTNRVSAIVDGERSAFGLIEGYDIENKLLLFKKIPNDIEIATGATVVTSGLGGTFPRGLVIGTVTEVVPDEYGLTQMAFIEPSADFYDIGHVMVIERKILGTKDMQEESK